MFTMGVQKILRILAGFLTLCLPSAVAAANVNDMLSLFGGLMRAGIIESSRTEWRKVRPAELACIEDQLQRQGASTEILAQQGIFPNDGRVAGVRALCARAAAPPTQVAIPPANQPTIPTTSQTPTSRNLSLQPSFDCIGVKSALGSILCTDQAGAKADWDVDTAFKAMKYSLPESARDALSRSHEDWIQSVDQKCRLSRRAPTYSSQQRSCVLNAYAAKASSYRSKLNGDALVETRLSPEERAEIQNRLIVLGLLHGDADGQFGSDTRYAIRAFQEQLGDPPTEFLSTAQRMRLAQGSASPSETGPSLKPQLPTDESPEVRASNEKRCQSEDPDDRQAGCTAIIDAQGKGYKVALADAYDGRCRSYNDQHTYDRAAQDCKAAIARNSRNKYAYNNLGAALTGQGDIKGALAAYSTSIDLDPNWIYSRLARGRIYADMKEKDKAKIDFDKVLLVDPSYQQAKDALATLQVVSPTLMDARLYLDDAKQFVSELKQAPESLPQIASAAVDLEVAIKGFNDPAASRAKFRLADLLVQLPGFQDFMNGRQEDRNRVNKKTLLTAIEKSAVQRACADNYVKNDIGNFKNAASNRLREALDYAVRQQSVIEIEKASSGLDDFFKTNGVPCELPPTEQRPTADMALLKAFRAYLDDVQVFLRTQPDMDQEKIVNIAIVAKRLQEAITKSNESEGKQFKTQLDDLLEPVNGFKKFLSDREEQRQRELSRQFTLESAKAEKGIYFITEYLRENLANSKTETLSSLRMRLDSARRPSAISEPSVNALSNTNGALDAFIRDNSLSSDYARIVANFGHPSTAPVPEPGFPITPKTKFAVEGPDDDMVFLYNSAASAPSVTKDITGKFIFLTGSGSVCFAQSALIDEDQRWFLERTLRQDGSKGIKEDSSPCDFTKVPTSVDFVVYQRGELRKQRKDYIIGLTDLLQNEVLREYRVVSAADYDRAIQGIRSLSLQIASDVESNKRTGFGVIIVTDVGSPACAIAGDHVTGVGLAELLQRDKELISRRLRFDWNIVSMTAENAFVALTRQQCGYAAGDANTLRTLMQALQRDGKNYEFAPIWFMNADVTTAGTNEIKQRDAQEKAKTDQNNIDAALRQQQGTQKQAIEDALRRENGPRARALRDKVDGVVKADAFKPLTDAPRKAIETRGSFPTFATWLNRRFGDQWETTDVMSEIADYGKVQWNGRTLDGIIVQTTVAQKNRIKGVYETSCFVFGMVGDDEFSMSRDMFGVQCDSSRSTLEDWKSRRGFKSLWNAETAREAD